MIKLIKFIFRLLVLCIVIGGMLYGYARYIEPFQYKIHEQNIESQLIETPEGPLSVVFFADTHFGEYYSTEDFTKVVTTINSLEPDIVFFGGDLIDNYDEYTGNMSEVSAQLAKIEASVGKYAVYGNHDYSGQSQFDYPEIIEAGGFQLLINEYVGLDEYHIGVVGIDDIILGFGNPEAASYFREDYFNIAICHEPDIMDALLNYNVDLMVSGHTHGRQINIKFLDDYILPPYGKLYIKGDYRFDNERKTLLYVNSGIGMTKLPLRFGSPPEITNIMLEN